MPQHTANTPHTHYRPITRVQGFLSRNIASKRFVTAFLITLQIHCSTCSTLQTYRSRTRDPFPKHCMQTLCDGALQHTATHCKHTANTLQTHCNTLQHTANTLQHTADLPLANQEQSAQTSHADGSWWQSATHCKHTAAHCKYTANTLKTHRKYTETHYRPITRKQGILCRDITRRRFVMAICKKPIPPVVCNYW